MDQRKRNSRLLLFKLEYWKYTLIYEFIYQSFKEWNVEFSFIVHHYFDPITIFFNFIYVVTIKVIWRNCGQWFKKLQEWADCYCPNFRHQVTKNEDLLKQNILSRVFDCGNIDRFLMEKHLFEMCLSMNLKYEKYEMKIILLWNMY